MVISTLDAIQQQAFASLSLAEEKSCMSKNEVLNELHTNSTISIRVHRDITAILPDNLSKGLRDTPEVPTLLSSHAF